MPERPKSLTRFNWSDIQIFLALARHKSLTQAGRALRINHATVSRRIRTLEQALEAKLFEHNRYGFLLTDAGERLLSEAEGVESHIQNIALDFSGDSKSVDGTVRVATMEAFGSLFLAPRVIQLYQAHSSIQLELVTASHWVNLSKREADILISFPKPQGRRLTVFKIGEFALYLYASEPYLARHGVPQEVGDLYSHQFVDYIDELVEISTVRWLAEAMSHPPSAFRSTSLVAQYHSAVTGMGIAMLPTFVGEPDARLVRVLPHEIRVMREFWLTVHNDIEHITRVRHVVEFLKTLIEANQDWLLGQGHRYGTEGQGTESAPKKTMPGNVRANRLEAGDGGR